MSFLQDYNRTHEGDVPLISAIANLTGDDTKIMVDEARKGTLKEVQTVTVTQGSKQAILDNNTAFTLTFGDEVTGPIPFAPSNTTGDWSCQRGTHEVQTLTIDTVDTIATGGDATVSSNLEFTLTYGDETTGKIVANPSNGDCSVAARDIRAELTALDAFFTVRVSNKALSNTEGCEWSITFTSTSGNIDQLYVTGYNDGAVMGPTYSATVGDDSLTMATTSQGDVDIIKTELEQLNGVGTVTVTVGELDQSEMRCEWSITFDSNAGDLPQMGVANATAGKAAGPHGKTLFTSDGGVTVETHTTQNGTSVAMGGDFALSFNGQRTGYMSYEASDLTVKTALESLSTIGSVDVTRAGPDENDGYTWTVTFLTELGNVESIIIDDADLTGTVPTGSVEEYTQGIFPPFDSLDPENGLPLGSATITDLSDLSLVVSSLEQGIPYYFRISAINSIGQGPALVSTPPFELPVPQYSDAPTSVTLAPVDGSTLKVAFGVPVRDGGEEVDKYRVEYAKQAFADEVQAVRVICNGTTEVQTITTGTEDIDEIQLIHAKLGE